MNLLTNWNTNNQFIIHSHNKTKKMDFHLSFDNVTPEEAAAIFTSIGNTLSKNTTGEAKLKEVAAKYDGELKTIVDKYNVPSPAEQALKENAEKEIPDLTTVTKVANPKKPKAKKTEEPVKEELDFDNVLGQTIEDEESKPEITKEAIQQHTQKLVKADASHKAQIIAILKSFKTDSISKLKPEDYEGFEKRLQELEALDDLSY